MSDNSEKKKVFISYAREDRETAWKLYSDLKNAEIEPWMESEDLLPGARLVETVRNQIKKSDFFLALVSEQSMSERGTVHSEIKLAQKILEEFPRSGTFIIPVRLDDCPTDYEITEGLKSVDLFLSYEDGFRDILRGFRSDMKPVKPSETPGVFQLNLNREKKESRSESSSYALLTFLCLVAIALSVTVILFVFFPVKVKEENVWEQVVPAVLCTSVFCSVLLSLAKAYKTAFKTIIILLVPLCMSFSVVTSAFVLDVSPFEIIRVIITLDIERKDHNIPENPVKAPQPQPKNSGQAEPVPHTVKPVKFEVEVKSDKPGVTKSDESLKKTETPSVQSSVADNGTITDTVPEIIKTKPDTENILCKRWDLKRRSQTDEKPPGKPYNSTFQRTEKPEITRTRADQPARRPK